MDCKHERFAANCKVTRLTDEQDNEKVSGYTMDVQVHCTECGVMFQFIGLPAGFSPNQPMTNIDATEVRMPIRPSNAPREIKEGTIVN